MKGSEVFKLLLPLVVALGCSKEDPAPAIINGDIPPTKSAICKVQEIEFRNRDDEITGIRDFNYNINLNNRLESMTIVEGLNSDPLTLRFEFNYSNIEHDSLLTTINEVFGGDVVTSTVFRYDTDGNLIELTRNHLSEPFTDPPEFHVFSYEESELANDSINARIIVFDIDRLTRDWIDILPANFTHGGRRIIRYEKQAFRGDLISFCDLGYTSEGFLSTMVCRTGDGILRDVWDFTYENDRLIWAYRQQPNFRALTTYKYDSELKPVEVVSTTDGRFNWRGAYFFVCR